MISSGHVTATLSRCLNFTVFWDQGIKHDHVVSSQAILLFQRFRDIRGMARDVLRLHFHFPFSILEDSLVQRDSVESIESATLQ